MQAIPDASRIDSMNTLCIPSLTEEQHSLQALRELREREKLGVQKRILLIGSHNLPSPYAQSDRMELLGKEITERYPLCNIDWSDTYSEQNDNITYDKIICLLDLELEERLKLAVVTDKASVHLMSEYALDPLGVLAYGQTLFNGLATGYYSGKIGCLPENVARALALTSERTAITKLEDLLLWIGCR